MAGIGSLSELLAQGASTGVGVGIGIPLAGVLEPTAVDLVQNAWGPAPIRVLPVNDLARIIAQALHDETDAHLQANATGIANDRFDLLVQAELRAPTVGELLLLIRRNEVSQDEITHALRKGQLDPMWDDRIAGLASVRLELGALATAVHRGIMHDAGLLVTPVPSGEGNVPRIPVSTLDTLAEFAAQGIDPERARVLVADTGLPLALGEMLALLNRGEVTDIDVMVAIAESNIRNEYMDVALKLARRLLTPHEYAESELRGIKTRAEAEAGAALSGLETDDYETLFGIMGRPLNVHQITTGLARGGTFGGGYETVPEPYQDAIRRSAIRPEYADLAYHDRYTYPSAFVLRSLAEAGDLGDTTAVARLLEEIGWKPSLAAKVSAKWVPAGATADPHIAKARTQLWTATHSSYVKGEIGTTDATTALTTAGVDPASIADVLAVWHAERALIRKQLSVAQIKKAVSDAVVNVATGVAWTVADAVAALVDRGYSQADAQTIMAEA